MHVADGVDVDQRADAGDEQAHGDAQRVGEEGHVDLQRADGQPLEQRRRRGVRSSASVAEQVDERDDGDDERAGEHRRGEVAGPRIAETAAEHDEDQEPGSGRPGSARSVKHGLTRRRGAASGCRGGLSPHSVDRSTRVTRHPQLGEVVGGGAGAAAEDGHDDAEADDRLGGGDDEDEEHGRLSVDVAEAPRQGDEAEVDGVEHQLDAHEQHERVAAHEHADRADAEQHGAEHEVPRRPSATGAVEREHARLRCSSPRSARRRVSTTVPATATTSSTDVSSKANTWSPNRLRLSCLMLASGVTSSARLGRPLGDLDVEADTDLQRSAVACREDRRDEEADDGDADDRRQRALDRQRLDLAGPRPGRRRAA